MPLLAAGPPTTREQLPSQVYGPLMTVFSWLMWFGAVFSIASFMLTLAMLAWQKRSASSTHLVEEAVLLRICIAAAVLGSATSTANALLG